MEKSKTGEKTKKKHRPPRPSASLSPAALGENADEIYFASGKVVEMISRGWRRKFHGLPRGKFARLEKSRAAFISPLREMRISTKRYTAEQSDSPRRNYPAGYHRRARNN